jgi:hypothetical protein
MTLKREERILAIEKGSSRSHWKTPFGKYYGPVIKQTTD